MKLITCLYKGEERVAEALRLLHIRGLCFMIWKTLEKETCI